MNKAARMRLRTKQRRKRGHGPRFFLTHRKSHKHPTSRAAEAPEIPVFGQAFLLIKLGTYLSRLNRAIDQHCSQDLLDMKNGKSAGYCHGLTLLWLQMMLEGREEWFYNIVKKIILCPDDKLLDMDVNIEKLLARIEWAQNADIYLSCITQLSVDFIMDDSYSLRSFDNVYSIEALALFFHKQNKPNQMICISVACEHTVGVFVRNGNYYFYDSNDASGEAMVFNHSLDLAREVIDRLSSVAQKPIESHAMLEIKIIDAAPRETLSAYLSRLKENYVIKPLQATYSLFSMFTHQVVLDDKMDIDENNGLTTQYDGNNGTNQNII